MPEPRISGSKSTSREPRVGPHFVRCERQQIGGVGRVGGWIVCVMAMALAPRGLGQEPPRLPDPAELPAQAGLPDPLVMLDGRRVDSPEMWFRERRPELLRLFQRYMYGQLPPTPETVSSTLERTDTTAFGGRATLREVTLRCGPRENPPIHLMLVTPNHRPSPAPVILVMNYFGNHTLLHDRAVRLATNWIPERGVGVVGNRATEAARGSRADLWPMADLIERGYALATFYNGDVDPDTPAMRGVQRHVSVSNPEDECGTIGAWAWGLQRAVDYLLRAPGIDPQRIVVTGHSRLGKAALVAGAFDERIALVIPHQAGCGGSAPSRARIALGKPFNTLDTLRTKPPETVKDINESFPHWFNARFKQFNTQPERLPFDQHCLIALCAPRPVLLSNGRSDTWINPAGQFEVIRGAAPVYRLLGAGDFKATELPPDNAPGNEPLGYYLRPGGHSWLREDWKVFLDYADQQFAAKSRPTEAGRSRGPIMIDPLHPRSFRHASGERFFPMGDTAYFLLAQPTNVIARFIDVRRAHRFNFIRIMPAADGFWPFGGTPAAPDYTVIREHALRKLDWTFDHAADRGMNIELILWGYGVGGGEGLWASHSLQESWVDTLVRRYKDRPNLFLYTVANEFERYPDGRYEFSRDDVAWARNIAARIRTLDPDRPIGCHPSVWITDQDPEGGASRPFATYAGFTQRRPQVVWPLWKGSAVNVHVTQNNEGIQPRTWGNIGSGRRGLTYYAANWQGTDYPVEWTVTGWNFEGAGMEDCIAADGSHGKPILNLEFGYQYEPGYESSAGYVTRQAHDPATVRRKAWKIATAGGYFAAGFLCTAVERTITEDDVDHFRPAFLETLHDFFTARTEYWKMAPRLEDVAAHNVLLALPGIEYVAYFPRGGTNDIRLASGDYNIEWLHPESGEYVGLPRRTVVEGTHRFVPPRNPSDDWVLHLWKERLPVASTGVLDQP